MLDDTAEPSKKGEQKQHAVNTVQQIDRLLLLPRTHRHITTTTTAAAAAATTTATAIHPQMRRRHHHRSTGARRNEMSTLAAGTAGSTAHIKPVSHRQLICTIARRGRG